MHQLVQGTLPKLPLVPVLVDFPSLTKHQVSVTIKNRGKKRELQKVVVWYSGPYTNKYDKLMDTSIQVLCNVKI